MQEKLVYRIRAGGGLHEGQDDCLKYLKRVEHKKGGGETKILKRGASWSRGGCLRKGVGC